VAEGVPDRLAGAASRWAALAADLVPVLPVRPGSGAAPEAHVLSTVCVELVQPLAAMAARWADGAKTTPLGRVEVKLRHLEAVERTVGRDLGVSRAAPDTRLVLEELEVRSTAPRREGGAPGAWFEVAVGGEEAVVARRVLLSLSEALGQRVGVSTRRAGSPEYRFRDGPAVLAFWSMKVETCSPGVTQRLALRVARRSPRRAIADATAELLARLRDEPGDVLGTERYADLVSLCERTASDLATS
jgi:hypothetical protein